MKSLLHISLIVFSSILVSGCVTALPKSLATETVIGNITRNAEKVPNDSTKSEIVRIMGSPSVSFTSPDNSAEYLHYCNYGFTREEEYGFWLINGVLQKRMTGLPDGIVTINGYTQEGLVYADKTVWDCYSGLSIDWTASPITERVKEEFYIDRLKLTLTYPKYDNCLSGHRYTLQLEGQINADSSFSVDKVLSGLNLCITNGGVVFPAVVELDSGGGFLKDGYELGLILKKHKVKAVIRDGNTCASSCALGFLGAEKRSIEGNGTIIFHAPYIRTNDGIYCASNDAVTDSLVEYLESLFPSEEANRLFDRTMSYCDSNDGWVIQGASAARLYGIVNE